jgi:cation diffusion facilitator family transporter
MNNKYCTSCISKSAWFAIWASLLLAMLQALVGVVSGSTACLAIAVQSVANIITSASMLVTQRVASKKPDEHFPFGYGKAEYIAAGFTCVLFAVVTLCITWLAVQQFMTTQGKTLDFSPFLVAVASIIGNEILFHYLRCVAMHTKSPSIMANAWANRADSYAASVVAVCSLGAWWGLPKLDAVATIVVAFLVVRVLYQVFADAIRGLMDKSANDRYAERIENIVHGVPGVLLLKRLKTVQTGRKVVAELVILIDVDINIQQAYAISESVRTELMNKIDELDDVVVGFKPGKMPNCGKAGGIQEPVGGSA